MSIKFACEKCGHPLDVSDRLAGKRGACVHCGHRMRIPATAHAPATAPPSQPDPVSAGPSLRLRPISDEPPRVADHLLANPAAMNLRPATAEPRPMPQAISLPDHDDPEDGRLPRRKRRDENYEVRDPYRVGRSRGRAGPPPFWVNIPTLTARWASRRLRNTRNGLYLVSIFGIVVVLYAYLFHSKAALHFGATVVVLSNITMIVVGLTYLISLPFKQSFLQGVANVLIPPYAVYYWVKHWRRMRRPVYRTLGSFLPVALVVLAYVIYREAPVVEKELEREFPGVMGKAPSADEARPDAGESETKAVGPGKVLNEAVDRIVKPLESVIDEDR